MLLRPKVTYYGHSCFAVELSGKSILFDPFITPNPKASMIDVSTINPDIMLISHGHGDHIADAVTIAKQSECTVIAAYEITEWLGRQGVENCIPMNTGGSISLGFCNVKLVRAEHSSSFPDGAYAGNAIGFVVESKEATLYYAGDTALTLDMQLIPVNFNVDVAFLPIGDNFTMGVDDACQAAKLVQCDQVVGMHFDTFPPIEIDHTLAKKTFRDNDLHLTLPIINQTIEL